MRSRAERAFSLVEAVFSSFLLLTAVSMSIWVFDASMKAGAENDRRVLATIVAQNRIEELRAQASTSFMGGLAGLNGVSSVPEAPGMQIITHAALKTLLTPCSGIENQYPPAVPGNPYTLAPKAMQNSAWQADVEVKWSDRPSDRVSLTTYIADWRDLTYHIRITPIDGSSSVPPRTTVGFAAEGRDASGQLIDDLMFSWYVIPNMGMGTVANVSRDGKYCQYKNYFRKSANEFDVQPGACNVQATAVYRGNPQQAQYQVTNEP